MTVRKVPPSNYDSSDETAEKPRINQYPFEEYYSFDEALWRAELRQTTQQLEGFRCLLDVVKGLKDMIPQLRLKSQGDKAKVLQVLANLDGTITDLEALDAGNMTLEMERQLFIGSLLSSLTEYAARGGQDHYYAEIIANVVRRVAAHYWKYEQGSVLDSAMTVDIELSFIDPDGEVAKLVKDQGVTEQVARKQIMTKAVHALRLTGDVDTKSAVLTWLKKKVPERFKDVEKL